MKVNPLGKKTKIKTKHSPDILYGIARKIGRTNNGINESAFSGFDIWKCYEASWLDKNGKPESGVLKIIYPSSTPKIVESKSLKLYLFSLSNTHFEDTNNFSATVKRDLVKVLESEDISVTLYGYEKKIPPYTKIPKKLLIERLPLKIERTKPDAKIFELEESPRKTMEVFSNALVSNCPVTKQPDYATVYLKYSSHLKITDASLLKYIASFKNHFDFHEACAEKIFTDILNRLNPSSLIVKCFFTRRGGIEINPVRFFNESFNEKKDFHYWRQ